jgi:dihydrofolate synthase/folylpolyglutamate synthase
MLQSSSTILENFRMRYGKDIDLTLRPAYRDLLAKLGKPHHKLPPVFHIAGTNGKGSTCAFLRALLEAAGYRVHVYTSPHLVRFHERIRIAGQLISENELAEILAECEQHAAPGGVSYFEASTAAAFVAFARHAADFTILETGLGGRLDATNVVDRPLATLITRLSFDHREYLGNSIDQIAREKAGIMRPGVPCFAAAQPEALALQALRDCAAKIRAPLSVGGVDWTIAEQKDGFRFADARCAFDLPHPALLGQHQYQNAGLAIAALDVLPKPLSFAAVTQGMAKVEWPARLQALTGGALAGLVPTGTTLWLDGGHNDSAGEVLAAQIVRWRREDGDAFKPLHIILGMLTTKNPAEFLGPFAQYVAQARSVPIPNETLSFTAPALADEVKKLGIAHVHTSTDITAALTDIAAHTQTPSRILICGSLYLAGIALAQS